MTKKVLLEPSSLDMWNGYFFGSIFYNLSIYAVKNLLSLVKTIFSTTFEQFIHHAETRELVILEQIQNIKP